MDKLTEYSTILKRLLTEYVELYKRQPVPGVETFLILGMRSLRR